MKAVEWRVKSGEWVWGGGVVVAVRDDEHLFVLVASVI